MIVRDSKHASHHLTFVKLLINYDVLSSLVYIIPNKFFLQFEQFCENKPYSFEMSLAC